MKDCDVCHEDLNRTHQVFRFMSFLCHFFYYCEVTQTKEEFPFVFFKSVSSVFCCICVAAMRGSSPVPTAIQNMLVYTKYEGGWFSRAKQTNHENHQRRSCFKRTSAPDHVPHISGLRPSFCDLCIFATLRSRNRFIFSGQD